MSAKAKDCGKHGHRELHKLYWAIFTFVAVVVVLVLLAILIIWLVLRPTRPRFTLRDATLYQFNLSEPSFLTSTLQITVSSYNPNDHVGIYYDRLDVFVTYKDQQITVPTALPRGYQGHHDVNVWSPFVSGNNVPLAPYLAVAVGQDENAGFMLLYVKLDGRLRWRVGSWMSGRYHISVNCPAFLAVDKTGSFRFQQITSCSVDV